MNPDRYDYINNTPSTSATIQELIEASVERGRVWLDTHIPGWRETLRERLANTSEGLDIMHPRRCVLGRLHEGGYWNACEAYGLRPGQNEVGQGAAAHYGFTAPTLYEPSDRLALTRAWLKVIGLAPVVLHCSITAEGLISKWDSEHNARGVAGESYVALVLTPEQLAQFQAGAQRTVVVR